MKLSKRAIVAVTGYLALYAASIVYLSSIPEFSAGESLAVFLIFGVGFSIAAWIVTAGIRPAAMEVRRPGEEFGTVLIYLLLFALLVLGWGFSAVRETVIREPGQSIAILLLKMATMVAIPALILRAFGHQPADLFRIVPLRKAGWRAAIIMAILLFALQAVLGRGLQTLQTSNASLSLILALAPLALIWFCLEAGLAEEFLFRLFLQTRASAWLQSETAGIVVMAALFGLAHAPGYVLRGQHLMEGMPGPPGVLTAAAYSIAVVSPIGLMFGVLWKRTRNLWLLVFLHGWTDLLPNLAGFIKAWTSSA
jgi:membrane protease YdiL (CAAX protease family)